MQKAIKAVGKDRPGRDFDLKSISATSFSLVLTDTTLRDNPIVFVNSAFSRLTGYRAEEVLGRNCRLLQGPETDPAVVAEIRAAIDGGLSVRKELVNYRKNGEKFWMDAAIDPVCDDRGQVVGFVSIQSDVTAKRSAESSLAEAEQRLRAISGNIPGYIFQRVLKPDGAILMPLISASLNAILGIRSDSPVTADEFFKFLHPDDYTAFTEAVFRSAAGMSVFEEDIRLVSPQGDLHWFRSTAMPLRLSNGDIVWDGMAIEITSEKTARIELNFLASHDSLTGLSNRVAFRNALREAAQSLSCEQQAGLFYINLDGFQSINDTWGEVLGDMVLRRVAVRLSEFAMIAGGSVARLGGDEFALLLPVLAPDNPILKLAESIRRELARVMVIDGHEIGVDACIGAAVFPLATGTDIPESSDPATEWIDRAYLALHDAKRRGQGLTWLYSSESDERFRNRRTLRQSLQRAINEPKEFELHYQPLVDLISGEIVAAEALLRWNHPELGFQPPDLFIPIAESSGLIVPLGAWVLKTAMTQAKSWRALSLKTPKISINVSGVQLQNPGFIATVEQVLEETGENPHDFELELTEGVLIDASVDLRAQLSTLKAMGFELAIDDFGTGHSTFKYLRDFPVDVIKIDQTFVRHLVLGSSDESIIRAMLGLARSLGLKVVAEGIETLMQRNFLRDEGCEIGQGYLFSMPLKAEDFGWLLGKGVSLPMTEEKQTTQRSGSNNG